MNTTEIITKAKDNISKAKVQLIQNQPFFACLSMRLQFVPAEIERCRTNGLTISYNPEYFSDLSIDMLQTVLAEEVMHLALLHHTRRDKRDPKRWNLAADYAVTPLLRKADFALPPNPREDQAYANMSAEQIYQRLPDPPPDPGNQEFDTSLGLGDVEDPPSETNVPEMEAKVKQSVAMAAMMARRAGPLPEGIERLIQEILTPKVDWKEALARFITEIVPNDYTWMKPAKRYLHMGLFLPTLESTESGQVILMVDTSISIGQALLNQVGAEAKEIADTFHIDLSVMYVDAVMQGIQQIDRDDPIRLDPKGGGGTDFRPGFDHIEKNDLQPKAVVYLTDGYCDDFPEPPDYPVLWTIFDNNEFDPPFGEVIHIQ